MKYTMSQVIASLPGTKNSADSYWTRWILRPLSYPVSVIALNIKLTPNGISWISALCAVAGGFLFGAAGYVSPANAPVLQWIGIGLLFLFSVLDCADGNMARTIGKPNPFGSWTDAVGGYIAYTAALLGLGLAVEYASGGAGGLFGGIGGFAAAANMLMRAAVQSHRLTKIKVFGTPDSESNDPGGEKRLSENLGVTGLLVPAFATGYATNTLVFVLGFYTLFYGLGSVWVVFKLAWSNYKNGASK